MASVLPYLLYRAAFRVRAFLHDWYIGGFCFIAHALLSLLEALDRTLALRITIRHLVEPLYGDRTIVGYAVGIPFRLARVAVALTLYLAIALVALALYLIWILIPLFIALYPTVRGRTALP